MSRTSSGDFVKISPAISELRHMDLPCPAAPPTSTCGRRASSRTTSFPKSSTPTTNGRANSCDPPALDFTCRTDRKAYVLTPQGYKANDGGLYLSWFDYDRTLDLGDICNLSLNATWRFTPAFSVFANIDNMLCRRYDIIYGVPSARLSGLVGLTFKF